MTQAGWYPDPAGQPQTYRYWNGSSWSPETSGDPYAPPPTQHPTPTPPAPPPPPAPPVPSPAQPPAQPPVTVLAGGGLTPPPGGYGQPQQFGGGFPPSPSTAGGGSGRSGTTILLVVVAVLALVGLSVAGFVGYRILSDDDDTATDAADSSTPTQTSTSEPTEPTASTDISTPTAPPPSPSPSYGTTVTDQQCLDGHPKPSAEPPDDASRISGGPLSIPIPHGYTVETSYSPTFTFADDFTPVQKVIEQNDTTGWVSIYGVGGLRRANGFTDPAQAAEVVMTCMAQSPDLYQDFTGREDVSSGAITVDGNDAYQLTSELRVDNPDLTVEGDVAQVIVVDMGDPQMFGLYITVAPIGNQKLIDQQEAFVSRIDVD